jgi:hypothetical protein
MQRLGCFYSNESESIYLNGFTIGKYGPVIDKYSDKSSCID